MRGGRRPSGSSLPGVSHGNWLRADFCAAPERRTPLPMYVTTAHSTAFRLPELALCSKCVARENFCFTQSTRLRGACALLMDRWLQSTRVARPASRGRLGDSQNPARDCATRLTIASIDDRWRALLTDGSAIAGV